MTDINKLCDELEALLKAATPGPWEFSTVKTQCSVCHKVGPFPSKRKEWSHACIYDDYPGRSGGTLELLANAGLIAALRNAAQPLIDAARESVKLRDEINVLHLRHEGCKAATNTLQKKIEELRERIQELEQQVSNLHDMLE